MITIYNYRNKIKIRFNFINSIVINTNNYYTSDKGFYRILDEERNMRYELPIANTIVIHLNELF